MANGRAVSRAEAEPIMAQVRDAFRGAALSSKSLTGSKWRCSARASPSSPSSTSSRSRTALLTSGLAPTPSKDRRRLEDLRHRHLSARRLRQPRLTSLVLLGVTRRAAYPACSWSVFDDLRELLGSVPFPAVGVGLIEISRDVPGRMLVQRGPHVRGSGRRANRRVSDAGDKIVIFGRPRHQHVTP